MTAPWDEIWPVAEPQPEFALQVLVAAAKPPTRRWRQVAWLLAALLPCVALGVGAFALREHQQEAVRRAVLLQAQRRETEERLRRLQAEFELANRRERELMASLADAKDEATRTKLQAELQAQKTSVAAAKGAVRGGGATPARALGHHKPRPSSCSPGDPLCDP